MHVIPRKISTFYMLSTRHYTISNHDVVKTALLRPDASPIFVGLTPANTGHSPNAVSMLGQRRRRWANIETALGECPVFAGTPKDHRP